MRISWITSAKHTKSIVEYGKSPGKYQESAMGEDTSYHYFFYRSGKIHHTVIGPLEASTTYYYRCGGSGPEFSFRTPPSSFPVEFAIVGEYVVPHPLHFITYTGKFSSLQFPLRALFASTFSGSCYVC